jgi:hypothetical protein
MVEQQTFD